MKYLLLFISLFLSGASMSSEIALKDISQLVWKNRVIIILSGVNDSYYQGLFEQYDNEVKERDVLWFILKNDNVETNYPNKLSDDFITRTKSQYPIEQEKTLLIGKDGGIKVRADKLDLDLLFEEIDSMSMRQAEMKRKD
jgi:hypothetical protein